MVARSLAVDPGNSDVIYASLHGGGVLKSINGGASWIGASQGLGSNEVFSLAIDPLNTLNLYAGTVAGGVFKSTNGGLNWFSSNTGLSALTVPAIALNPKSPTTLYAGAVSNGVFKSIDGGSTWTAASTGLNNVNVISLAVDPDNPATVYAGTAEGKIFKSTNSALPSSYQLSTLSLDAGAASFSPPFSPGVLSYSASVSSPSVTLQPVALAADATIAVNGTPVTSGASTSPVPLNVGDNTLTVVVSAAGGGTQTYTLTVTRIAVPDTPTGVSATPGVPGSGQVLVSWAEPANNGSAITAYTVTGSPSGHCTPSPPTTSCLLEGLPNATQYSFTVTATNGVGPGTASTPIAPVWLQGAQSIVFAAPAAQNFGTTPTLTATGGASGQAVAFNATGVCSINAGGVLSFSSAGSCTVTASQAGTSAYAAPAPVVHNFAVNAVAPGAPAVGSVVIGNGQATVNWVAPVSNGGSALTGYTVTAVQDGTRSCTAAAGDSSCTVMGLANGTAYTFAITATNAASLTGSAATSTSPVTPIAPQTITFNPLTAQNFGATTAPVLSATATSGLGVDFASTTPLVCSVSGTAVTLLAVGTCTIEATEAGNAAWLAATPVQQGFAVNAVVPGAPTAVQATAGNAQVALAWTAPVFDGGSALTGYRAEVVGDAAKFCAPAASATGTGCSIGGLANGTAYAFQVVAINSVGNSAASAASTSVTPQAPASGGGGGGGPTPPTGGSITVPANGSATLGSAGSATLGAGATLTVQPQAAGSPITPPATGTASVALGASGGSVTLGLPSGGMPGGQAVVLAPATGGGAPVLGLLPGGSVLVGGSTPGQVLLDVGPVGMAGVASGQQLVAGPGGAQVEARRDANGATTVQVLQGSAVAPCGAPCPPVAVGAAPATITLLPGEVAQFDAQGRVQQVSVQVPLLQPVGGAAGPAVPTPLPALAGTAPTRTPGLNLLAQAQAALQGLLGLPLNSQGQQPLGNAVWTQGGMALGLLPLGLPQVDLVLPDGASLQPDGTLRVVHQGVVQRFGPAPLDLQAASEALRAVLPQAGLRVADSGTWWIEPAGGGAPLVLRPGWLAQQGAAPQPPVSRLEADGAGQLWLLQANGLRTPLYPALAEPAALQALLRAADSQSTLQVQLDGTVLLRLAGGGYRLVPLPALQPAPAQRAGEAMWLEIAEGQLLLWMRVGDGRWAQALAVSTP